MNEIKTSIIELGKQAKEAATSMAAAPTAQRNKALLAMANLLREKLASLVEANEPDIVQAQNNKLAVPMVDRLRLTPEVIETLAQGCEQLAAMPDPIGQIVNLRQQPSGISVGQMRVPLGVFCMIYESRPNVTIEAASLAIKSGNAAILRGGSEAFHSNKALTELTQEALHQAGLPAHGIQLVPTTDRDAVTYLLAMSGYIDILIPRGGRSLIERVMQGTKIPILKHLDGNCHTYVDAPVDIDMALRVVENAKTQSFSPCNTTECLLIARGVMDEFLPKLVDILIKKGIEMRIPPEIHRMFLNTPGAKLVPVAEDEWTEEYLAPIIRMKLVKGLDEAIAHINKYGSHHTDAILTNSHQNAMRFLREVDSSSVMVNTSTRFADGFQYGLGAEIGISTDKLHARGPVGLEGLTSLKWVVLGQGEIRN
ncbi:MAG: glutamate-5-semialdehyde dehydrogenase [Saezia sp.]